MKAFVTHGNDVEFDGTTYRLRTNVILASDGKGGTVPIQVVTSSLTTAGFAKGAIVASIVAAAAALPNPIVVDEVVFPDFSVIPV